MKKTASAGQSRNIDVEEEKSIVLILEEGPSAVQKISVARKH
jgi:hypothetical protein